MKVAIISDTHFGAKNDCPYLLDHSLSYFENIFFPYLKDNNIKTIIHMGDLMDSRKYVNFNTLSQVRKRFMQHIKANEIDFHCIIGNHDTYFRNTNDVNSVQELFEYNLNLYSVAKEVTIGGLPMLFIPWINKSNADDAYKAIIQSKCEFALGHLEISGFEVIRGVKHEEGLDISLFDKFEKVFSGHFHCKQSHKNIEYFGTQYQITFNDLNERKGFHVFDTETREIEYIKNTSKLFYQIKYDDKNYEMMETEFERYAKTFVRVIVDTKTNPIVYDQFVQSLLDAGAYDVSIIEDYSEQQTMASSVDDVSKDTLTLINEEIDNLSDIDNKTKLKKMIHDLYLESLTVEE